MLKLVRAQAHRELLLSLATREFRARYRGSQLGLLWAILSPLLMLSLMTYVFVDIMRARWAASGSGASRIDYAVLVYAGLIVHGVFAEVISRAPQLIALNASYVKKVAFPVDVLPVVPVLGAMTHAMIGAFLLVCANFAFGGGVHRTVLWLPLPWLLMLLWALTLSWLLAAVGAFIRDLQQVVGVVVSALLFASPILYPVEQLPPELRYIFGVNPLTPVIEWTRSLVIYGYSPSRAEVIAHLLVAAACAQLSLLLYRRAARGFADVV